MPRLNLRRYDVQAKVSVVLSSVSLVFVVGTALLVFRNVDWSTMMIGYQTGNLRWLCLMGCAAMASLLSLLGLSFGANSAGRRRNDKQAQSWIGFFIGAFALTVTIILMTVFLLRGEGA